MDRDENVIKELNENYLIKDELEKERKALAEACLGEDVWENFYIDDNTDLTTLNDDLFKERTTQELALPFENETIRRMIEIPKKAINYTHPFENNGKFIQGVFLIGNDNGKPVLYALTIIKNKLDPSEFCIKLDIYVKGMTYFQLLRLDASGEKHPNYIKGGKPVKDKSEIEYATTPHLHMNTKECQILCNDFDYTTAKSVNLEKSTQKDDSKFRNGVELFKETINLLTELNLDVDKGFVFDNKNMTQANTCKDMEEFSK